jgi:hypothetical protein
MLRSQQLKAHLKQDLARSRVVFSVRVILAGMDEVWSHWQWHACPQSLTYACTRGSVSRGAQQQKRCGLKPTRRSHLVTHSLAFSHGLCLPAVT